MNELTNRSSFLYDYIVTGTNQFLPFQEGAFLRLAEIRSGSYTFSSLGTEISRAMNAAGENEYLVATDRTNRTYTISSDTNFDILVDSIYNGSVIFDLIGFTIDDKAGNNTYTSDVSTGTLFKPQFVLQSYTDFDNERRSIGGVRNESANGVNVENVKFGNYNVMTCNITNVTDLSMVKDAPIENNASGVEDLRDFLEYITDLRPVEFTPNRDDVVTFTECLLDSTRESKNGLDFAIKRVRGSYKHYETGELKFRRI